jgi:pyruvate/2-oxoglutarate dehydrogenase complex dihydrolipoamide acyltransferase (E2) component
VSARTAPIARQRRHTLAFLEEIRSVSPVFLSADVDMTQVTGHRAAMLAQGRRYSLVTYVLHAAARVIHEHPEANSALVGRLRPRLVRSPSAHGKLTLDKTLDGQRIVLTAVLPDLQRASLDGIQQLVDRYRTLDPAAAAQFAPVRALHKLPRALGRLAFHAAARSASRRTSTFGTFAVTSLGHGVVDDFYSVGGTTVTLGVGRCADRPVVRGGQIQVAPVLRLSLTFDHRVIDGAEAADVLGDLVARLEEFSAPSSASDQPVEHVAAEERAAG